METVQQSWVARAWALPCKASNGVRARAKTGYTRLKYRYGPRYAKAMLLAAFVALLSPVPGSTLVAVLLVVMIAEIHRTISTRGGFAEAVADLGVLRMSVPAWATGRWPARPLFKRTVGTERRRLVMAIDCDFGLRRDATPEQLTALGGALWRWCIRPARGNGIYQYLDSQPLSDLIAGGFPAPGNYPAFARQRGLRFTVRDSVSDDRRSAVDRLRREIPADAVEDVVVGGTSWNSTPPVTVCL